MQQELEASAGTDSPVKKQRGLQDQQTEKAEHRTLRQNRADGSDFQASVSSVDRALQLAPVRFDVVLLSRLPVLKANEESVQCIYAIKTGTKDKQYISVDVLAGDPGYTDLEVGCEKIRAKTAALKSREPDVLSLLVPGSWMLELDRWTVPHLSWTLDPIPYSFSCGPWCTVPGTLFCGVCGPLTVHPVVLMSAQKTDAEGFLKRPI
ncbi:hypothetical protein STEG23_033682, partial [Scotinomys teguina]